MLNRRPTRRPRPRRLLPALASSVLLLTGCRVAGTGFHPGVAAQVDDVTISTRHVDRVTDDYCTALEEVNKTQQGADQRTPLRFFTHQFATQLVRKAVAEQLAEQYDVRPTESYRSTLAQLEPQLVTLDEDQQEAVREVIGARAYADDVLTQIGAIELDDEDAGDEEKLEAGEQVFDEWVADHDVVINPKYSVELGSDGPVDTDVSYAVDTNAKAGLEAEPDPDYTAALPDHLTCLD